ncbi:MAG: type II toxin-antitoxin system Phd/YefM family antitoxin [Acidobacteria bacterium]|nr:type II toxin-antitoxin system Phd/YefM family antitoxin [Acidobacteriota bacterium]
MKTSGVSEVRKRLSAFLRMVEYGERVAITRRGRVVAELRPPVHMTEDDKYAVLRLHQRAGTVRLGGPNRPDLYPRPDRRLTSPVVQDLLDEVRGERNDLGPKTGE